MDNNENEKMCSIYVVLTHTGTILSEILKFVTKAKYNHSSISLVRDLSTMYSFGRLNPYFAFWGGYVKESKNFGVFKRFSKTEAAIFLIKIPRRKYSKMRKKLEKMYENRKKYHYNTIGLFAAFFGIYLKRKNDYFCSDFVSEILVDFNLVAPSKLNKIVKPMDFYYIFRKSLIFEGKLSDFNPNLSKSFYLNAF